MSQAGNPHASSSCSSSGLSQAGDQTAEAVAVAVARRMEAPSLPPKRGEVMRRILADFRGGGGGQTETAAAVAAAVRPMGAPSLLPPKRGGVMRGIVGSLTYPRFAYFSDMMRSGARV
ncbi:hypothetical protein HYC85_020034 [Camellia sinensis]|uniref:Uncharacterized protein n=1 Tax=Camellia sinensis TaxID=4442 RepID=A0A7J7GNM2_CAMSI|nr:hypothetical protein HYC85_020034 [Camellia sinensis]